MRLVGDEQSAPPARLAMRRRAGRHRLVGHGEPVPVGGLGAVGVRPVGLEVEPDTRRVGGPLAADVRRRGDDRDAIDAAVGHEQMGDPQPERRLAGGGRRCGEEAPAGTLEDPLERLRLPRAQRPRGGPRGDAGGRERCGGCLHRGAADNQARPTDRETPAPVSLDGY
jgi:hypothetical protein